MWLNVFDVAMASSDAAHDDTDGESIPTGRHESNERAQCHKPDTERNPLQDHVDNSHHPPVVLRFCRKCKLLAMVNDKAQHWLDVPEAGEALIELQLKCLLNTSDYITSQMAEKRTLKRAMELHERICRSQVASGSLSLR